MYYNGRKIEELEVEIFLKILIDKIAKVIYNSRS